MDEPIRKKDVRDLTERIEEIQKQLRQSTAEVINRVDTTGSKIISVLFSESRKIRQEIGSQTLILKMLEDNLNEIQFDENIGVSSIIELSIGGEIFGTGARYILNIDVNKISYEDLLKAVQLSSRIPNKIKEKVKSKLRKFFPPN
jgi:chemotaxis regulatin CheY-phosphate phosphatase CheZ